MYKRALRSWGLYKNTRPKGRYGPVSGAAAAPKTTRLCRYLQQTKLDEALNNLLYLFPPWIAHANVIWDTDARMHCPPRAAYIYDDFTQSIAAAVAAFERGETTIGGAGLRRAFVELETTLMPRSRSIFVLDSLFFALATLNQAKLHKASRLLISHAAGLVALRTESSPSPGSRETSPSRALVHGYEGEHVQHPFPQILNRLQSMASELEDDDSGMTDLVDRTWSTYHRLTSAASARSVSAHASQSEFWSQLLHIHSGRVTPDFINNKTDNWEDTVQPVLQYLQKLLSNARTTGNDHMRMVYMDEITAVYSFGHSQDFEETALSLLETVESKCAASEADDLILIEEWGCNAAFEMSSYYIHRGDFDNGVKYMARTFPAEHRAEWGALFMNQLQSWIQDPD